MSYVLQLTKATSNDDVDRQLVDSKDMAIIEISQQGVPNQGWRIIPVNKDAKIDFIDWESDSANATLRMSRVIQLVRKGEPATVIADLEAQGYTNVSHTGGKGYEATVQDSKVIVNTWEDAGVKQSNQYDDLAAAKVFTDSLADSDGYEVIDKEQPVGSAKTLVITHRPTLWNAWYEGEERAGSYLEYRVNGFGRTDDDRI